MTNRIGSPRVMLMSRLLVLAIATSGCTHMAGPSAVTAPPAKPDVKPQVAALESLKIDQPVALRLKADLNHIEKVSYYHTARSRSFEDNQVRTQKDETLEFNSNALTTKVEPEKDQFTQVLTTDKKQGEGDLTDFAMPEVGDKLEVTANSRGKILKSGDYPPNSLFFVSPISLPEQPVTVGDTWTMQANWLSLGEMVPYQLDMVSILKGFLKCGTDRCAEIEISGEVGLGGTIAKSMSFKSLWRGRIYFNIDAGTVVWSRVDSDETFISENVRREVNSCLEAVLTEPESEKLVGLGKPTCVGFINESAPTGAAVVPTTTTPPAAAPAK